MFHWMVLNICVNGEEVHPPISGLPCSLIESKDSGEELL